MSLKLSDLPAAYRHLAGGAQKKPSKYRNRRTVVDGISFDSKKEADYYAQLELERRAGSVLLFVRQPSFLLEGGVVYRADFLVIRTSGIGSQWTFFEVIDVKGCRTRSYLNKKKQFEARYAPVKIREV